jgi:hypothetical protein
LSHATESGQRNNKKAHERVDRLGFATAARVQIEPLDPFTHSAQALFCSASETAQRRTERLVDKSVGVVAGVFEVVEVAIPAAGAEDGD